MAICLFSVFFLYTMQHERCCWWSRLWKKLQMENWTVQTSMPGICILPNYRTVWSLYSHTKSSFVCMFMLMKFITNFCDQTTLQRGLLSGQWNLFLTCPASARQVNCCCCCCCVVFFGGEGGRFKWQKSCIQWCWSKSIKYLHANHSFPEWQAVKLTFFAPPRADVNEVLWTASKTSPEFFIWIGLLNNAFPFLKCVDWKMTNQSWQSKKCWAEIFILNQTATQHNGHW